MMAVLEAPQSIDDRIRAEMTRRGLSTPPVAPQEAIQPPVVQQPTMSIDDRIMAEMARRGLSTPQATDLPPVPESEPLPATPLHEGQTFPPSLVPQPAPPTNTLLTPPEQTYTPEQQQERDNQQQIVRDDMAMLQQETKPIEEQFGDPSKMDRQTRQEYLSKLEGFADKDGASTLYQSPHWTEDKDKYARELNTLLGQDSFGRKAIELEKQTKAYEQNVPRQTDMPDEMPPKDEVYVGNDGELYKSGRKLTPEQLQAENKDVDWTKVKDKYLWDQLETKDFDKIQHPAFKAADEIIHNLDDRRKVLDVLRNSTPEQQRQIGLVLNSPKYAEHLKAGRTEGIGRAVEALRGGFKGIAQPIMEMVGAGGTPEEVAMVRQFEGLASQTINPSQEGDAWYTRGPLQALEMAPQAVMAVGAGGAVKSAAGKLMTLTPKMAVAAEAAGITGAMFTPEYINTLDSFNEMGISDDKWWKKPVAAGTAGLVSLVESLIPNPFKVKNPSLTKGVRKAITDYMFEASKKFPGEMTEEYVQGALAGAGKVAASWLDGAVPDQNLGNALKEGMEQGNAALLPMMFMLGAPAGAGAIKSGIDAKKVQSRREFALTHPGVTSSSMAERTAAAEELQKARETAAQAAAVPEPVVETPPVIESPTPPPVIPPQPVPKQEQAPPPITRPGGEYRQKPIVDPDAVPTKPPIPQETTPVAPPTNLKEAFQQAGGAVADNYYSGLLDSINKKGDVPGPERNSSVGKAWQRVKDTMTPQQFVDDLRRLQDANKIQPPVPVETTQETPKPVENPQTPVVAPKSKGSKPKPVETTETQYPPGTQIKLSGMGKTIFEVQADGSVKEMGGVQRSMPPTALTARKPKDIEVVSPAASEVKPVETKPEPVKSKGKPVVAPVKPVDEKPVPPKKQNKGVVKPPIKTQATLPQELVDNEVSVNKTKSGWTVKGIPKETFDAIKNDYGGKNSRGDWFYFKQDPTEALVEAQREIDKEARLDAEADAQGLVRTSIGSLEPEQAEYFEKEVSGRLGVERERIQQRNDAVDELLANSIGKDRRGEFKLDLMRKAERSDSAKVKGFDLVVQYSKDHPELGLPQTEHELMDMLSSEGFTVEFDEASVREQIEAEVEGNIIGWIEDNISDKEAAEIAQYIETKEQDLFGNEVEPEKPKATKFETNKGNQKAFISGLGKDLPGQNTMFDVDGLDGKEDTFGEDVSQVLGAVSQIPISGNNLGKSVTGWFKRFFTAPGELPIEAYDAEVRRDGRVAKEMNKLRFQLTDIRRGIKKSLQGRELTQKDVEALNAVLQGQADPRTIPRELRAPIQAARDHIDALSRQLIAEGVAQGDLIGILEENEGFYITRSYRIFTDPKHRFNVPATIRNRAIAEVRSMYPTAEQVAAVDYDSLNKKELMDLAREWKLAGRSQMKVQELRDALRNLPTKSDADIQGIVESLLFRGAAETPQGLLKGSKLGSKDMSVLMERKEVPEWLRDLWGEYKDAGVNYARSVFKMSHLLANQQFLSEVREAGTGKWLRTPEEGPTVNEFGELITKIAADGSSVMEPLNGMYTTPEIRRAFEQIDKQFEMGDIKRIFMTVNYAVKYGKTVGSVMTHVRNLTSNTGFAVANGHWRVNKASKAIWATTVGMLQRDNAEGRQYYERLAELNLIGDDVHGGELKGALRDASKMDLDEFLYIPEARHATKMVKAGRAGLKAITDLYHAEDAVWKIFAWENEKARYRKAYPHWSQDKLERHTAEIVRNTYPTYSKIGQGIQNLRRWWLVGTFVSFPAEVVRTTFHTVELGMREMQAPETRAIGAQRIAGTMASMGILSALSRGMMHYLGIGSDEDEDLRWFVAPWQENSRFIYLAKKLGVYHFIDLGYSDPHAYLTDSVVAFMRGKDWKDKLLNSMGEFLSPFATEEILAKALMDARSNKDEKIYNPHDDLGEQAKGIVSHMWNKALEPGTISSVRRINTAIQGTDPNKTVFNEVTAMVSGVRFQKVDVEHSLGFRVRDFNKALTNIQNIARKTATSRGTATKEMVATDKLRMERLRLAEFSEMQQIIGAARRLGVPEDRLRDMLKNELNSEVAEQLMTGDYSQYGMTKTMVEQMIATSPEEFKERFSGWYGDDAPKELETFAKSIVYAIAYPATVDQDIQKGFEEKAEQLKVMGVTRDQAIQLMKDAYKEKERNLTSDRIIRINKLYAK